MRKKDICKRLVDLETVIEGLAKKIKVQGVQIKKLQSDALQHREEERKKTPKEDVTPAVILDEWQNGADNGTN